MHHRCLYYLAKPACTFLDRTIARDVYSLAQVSYVGPCDPPPEAGLVRPSLEAAVAPATDPPTEALPDAVLPPEAGLVRPSLEAAVAPAADPSTEALPDADPPPEAGLARPSLEAAVAPAADLPTEALPDAVPPPEAGLARPSLDCESGYDFG